MEWESPVRPVSVSHVKAAHYLLSCVAACLSACASVETKVTRFHRIPINGSGQTFTVSAPTRYGSAIELAGYSAQIAAHLEKYGWRRGAYKTADYFVGYEYGISDGRQVQSSVPIMGQTGGGTTYHSGTFNSYGRGGGSFSGTSYTPATFGVVGSRSVTQTVFGRWLLIIARDRRNNELFEIRCKSTGTSSEISQVLPSMIDAAFEKFPGKSGRTSNHTGRLAE
jgi:hypothetical protein